MLGATLPVRDYLDRVRHEIGRLEPSEMETICQLLEDAYHQGRFVFVIGNGGSGANASHICEDLNKGTLRDFQGQKRLKVLSLTDNTPAILAWGNDEGYDRIFVEQLKNYASPGDLLLAISGSGNSPNVLRAVEWANAQGMTTIGVTGYDGGQLRKLAHHGLHVALDDMGIVESLHMVAFHWIIDDMLRRLSAASAKAPTPVQPSHRPVA